MKDLKIYQSPLLQGGYDFNWKNGLVYGCIARFGKEINIQMIVSKDKGKGNAQEFVKKFKQYLKENGLKLVSSTPLNEVWRHICKKYKLKIYE